MWYRQALEPTKSGTPAKPFYDELNIEAEDEPQGPTCPVCAGPGVPLGKLGSLDYYRCRSCGSDYSA